MPDLKLEVVVIPVSDVDRANAGPGWRLDADSAFDNGFRVVQLTPPGSAQGLYLIVSDIEAARDDLVAHGADVSQVFHARTPGAQFDPDGAGRVSGPEPDHASYGSFAAFRDPDGNGWLLQDMVAEQAGEELPT